MRGILKYLLGCFYIASILLSCTDENISDAEFSNHSFVVSFSEGSIADSLGLGFDGDLIVNGSAAPLPITGGQARGNVRDADEYYAAYPSDAFLYFSPEDESAVSMHLPTLQTAVCGGIPKGTDIAVASSSTEDMRFELENMLTYIRFSITEEVGRIRSVSLISSDGTRISGDFSVSCIDSDREVFPLPASASNVCLSPSGDFFEPGEYYLAAFPWAFYGELVLLFENESGELARKIIPSTSEYLGGLIRDAGSVRSLHFCFEDFYPSSSTLVFMDHVAGRRQLVFMTGHQYNLKVTRGEDWLRIIDTRSLERHSAWFEVDANEGESRYGEITAESVDGSVRLVYTVRQKADRYYQPSDIRTALMDLYASTGGEQWTRNDNWGSDLPLSEWYGLSVDNGVVTYVRLSNNNLTGELPRSIGVLSEVYGGVQLGDNNISGRIPKGMFQHENVYLSNNQIESIESPDDPSDVRTVSLHLEGNRISGALPEFFADAPALQYVDLENNLFSGAIPASYTSLIAQDRRLYLNGNNLSGRLPESIVQNPDFQLSWMELLYQNGAGFDLEDVPLRAPISYIMYSDPQTGTVEGPYYAIDIYSKNRYTVIYEGWRPEDLSDELIAWYDAYHTSGLEVLSRPYLSASHNENGLDWVCVYVFRNASDVGITYPFYPSMGLVDSRGYYVIDPVTGTPDEIFALLEAEFGELPEPFPPAEPEPDPLPEPEVTVLQQASEGRGIDIVLMGDGYSVSDIEAGTYADDMTSAMEYFFEVEPFTAHRHLFNVYMVTIASAQSGYSEGAETPLDCTYGVGNSITGADEAAFDYAGMAVSSDRLDETLVIVILNSEEFGGSCYMYPCESEIYAGGNAVAYIPAVKSKLLFRGLVQHETAGHGFAKLADEYFSPSDPEISQERKIKLHQNEKYGWWSNVDFTADFAAVKWAHFLADERYANEGLGAYEGACEASSGVWRPTYRSIMSDNSGKFNPPSREIIWKRIHQLAYGSSWQYDYEVFAEYDRINRIPEVTVR